MPNFMPETAVASSAVAPLDSAVNILERLRDISVRAEDIILGLWVACGVVHDKIKVFEPYDSADELKDRRKSLADALLEIKIATDDLFEVVDRINELTS